MCTTIHYRSRICGHHWLQIAQPCWPGQGFWTCAAFGDGCARDPAPEVSYAGLCPACCGGGRGGGPGGYNLHYVRMITEIRERVRCGEGPCKADPGVECAVM